MISLDFTSEIEALKCTLICPNCRKLSQEPRRLTNCQHIVCKDCLRPEHTFCQQCNASYRSRDVEKCDVFIDKALAFVGKLEKRFPAGFVIKGLPPTVLTGNDGGRVPAARYGDPDILSSEKNAETTRKEIPVALRGNIDQSSSKQNGNALSTISTKIVRENKIDKPNFGPSSLKPNKIACETIPMVVQKKKNDKVSSDDFCKERETSSVSRHKSEPDSSSFFQTTVAAPKKKSSPRDSRKSGHDKKPPLDVVQRRGKTINFIQKNKNVVAAPSSRAQRCRKKATCPDCIGDGQLKIRSSSLGHSDAQRTEKDVEGNRKNVAGQSTKSKINHVRSTSSAEFENTVTTGTSKWFEWKEHVCPEIGENKLRAVQMPMKRNPKGETPLHLACKRGQKDTASQLISQCVDINATDWANWTPLHEAVHGRSASCVQLLLSEGALLNVPAENYRTPLHEAAELGHVVIAELLLTYGADKTALDYSGQTPINLCTIEEMKKVMAKNQTSMVLLPNLYIDVRNEAYTIEVSADSMRFLQANGWNIKNNPLGTDIMICVAGTEVNLHSVNLLQIILRGIMTIRENYLEEYMLTALPIQPHLIPSEILLSLLRSIANRLNKRPNLFDGMNFHIVGHDKPTTIGDVVYTKKDLSLLIKTGGGKILVRPPAERTVEQQLFYPYHCRQSARLRQCSNYIVYDESHPPLLLYNMAELRHVSSSWLVECIYNFKIDM